MGSGTGRVGGAKVRGDRDANDEMLEIVLVGLLTGVGVVAWPREGAGVGNDKSGTTLPL